MLLLSRFPTPLLSHSPLRQPSMTQPTTCLILGATGFIGGQIARAALARGWQVSGVRRSPDAVGDLAGLPIRWLQADLNDPDLAANRAA